MRNVTILLAVAAVVALSAPAYGAWVGGNGTGDNVNSWHVAANWSPSGVPTGDITVGTGTCQIREGDTAIWDSYGKVTVRGGAVLEVHAGRTLANRNNFWVGNGEGAGVESTLTQWGTVNAGYNLDLGTIGTGRYIVNGGALNVSARLLTVGANGTLEINGSAATITISSSASGYTQVAGGTLELNFSDGITKIDVTSDTATLAGTLTVTGTADAGTYTIIDYGTLSGTFDTVSLPSSDWSIDYNDGGKVTLTVIPEPATMVLLGIGGIGVLIRRRRK